MNAIELENKLKKFGYNLSNRAISNIIGITEQYYSNKKKNGTDFKQSDIEKIENKFNISLMADLVVQSNNTLINVLPCCASCGNGITIDSNLIGNYNPDAKYTFVFASGCSMTPTINDKDLCLIKNCDNFNVDGIYCFFIGDDVYIKRIVKNINQLVCISDNPDFDKIILKGDELDTIQIYGRVVTVIRKF